MLLVGLLFGLILEINEMKQDAGKKTLFEGHVELKTSSLSSAYKNDKTHLSKTRENNKNKIKLSMSHLVFIFSRTHGIPVVLPLFPLTHFAPGL